jgi:hypothetical protein
VRLWKQETINRPNEKAKPEDVMKKSILVAVLISGMLANTAYAGGRHGGGGVDPLWIPVAVLSGMVATAAVMSSPPPVTYERRVYYEPRQAVVYEEPRQTVIYEEPRQYRHERHERYYDRDRDYAPRYYEYR